MPLNSINYDSVAAEYVASQLYEKDENIVIFDIGARSGIAPYWQKLEKALQIVGFEPDEEECRRLNKAFSRKNQKFYPTALYDCKGERNFYLTNSPSCSGFEPIDPEFSSRFPEFPVNNSVLEVSKIKTTSIDEFIKRENLKQVDFLKVDVEGSELAILHGAKQTLHSKNVLGVLVEVWWEKSIKDNPPFAELDSYLRSQGFHFFDLSLEYYPRNPMPAGAIGFKETENQRIANAWVTQEKRGQAITGDALYLKDPVWEMTAGRNSIEWDDEKILKMVALFDTFNYGDCAAELLDYFRKRFARNVDVDHLLDLIVPKVSGTRLRYDHYFKLSKEIVTNRINAGPAAKKLGAFNCDHIHQPEYRPDDPGATGKNTDAEKESISDQSIQIETGGAGMAPLLQEEIDHLRVQNQNLEAHIVTIKQSRSWKMAQRLSRVYWALDRLWNHRFFNRIKQKLP